MLSLIRFYHTVLLFAFTAYGKIYFFTRTFSTHGMQHGTFRDISIYSSFQGDNEGDKEYTPAKQLLAE